MAEAGTQQRGRFGNSAHPGLRKRFASIVSAIENSEGNHKEADAIEERDRRGDVAVGAGGEGWAEKRVEVTEREIRQQPHMHRQGKKLCWHTKIGEIRGFKAAISPREGTRSPVRAERKSHASDVFAALAKRDR
jgi:hypothetical protein